MNRILCRLAVLCLIALATPAFAADAVYLPGARVALVPPDNVAPAKDFTGYAGDDGAKIVVTELPAAAYDEVDKAAASGTQPDSKAQLEPLKTAAGPAFMTFETAKDGTADVRRYSMIVKGDGFSGYVAVQVPAAAGGGFSDSAIRTMLASVQVRKDVPVQEQLSLLPFKLDELAGFKTIRTLGAGAVVMLSDATDDKDFNRQPYMLVGVVPAGPSQPDDRGRFAQQVAASIPGLREGRITTSEPIRIDGTPGFETRIDALTGPDSTPVTVVQWLRFGANNATLRIVASAARTDWSEAFPRFRAVRDGIGPR